ncbi:MAG: hypothetical protein FWD35_04370 [Oscillospiraceae bacterium]|nr:hypothetical protein [Oscillospiraceae bacterium]
MQKQAILNTIDTLPPSMLEPLYHYVSYLKSQSEKAKKRERFRKAIKNIPSVTLPADENGNAFIDKELHPELYDWAVNG